MANGSRISLPQDSVHRYVRSRRIIYTEESVYDYCAARTTGVYIGERR